MLTEERRQRVLEVLAKVGTLHTIRIAECLGVSEMTIRRDLSVLERRGLLQRVHGGAQPPPPHFAERERRSGSAHKAKERIGKLAAAQINDFETIYLDAGTTCLELARELKLREVRGVSILTHAVNIAAELAGSPRLTVIQVGGEIYADSYSATGPTTLATLGRFSFDRMFLAAVGLHPRFGVTSTNLLEAEVKVASRRRAAWVGLVLDSSKWQRQALTRVAELHDLDLLISDAALSPEARLHLETAGVAVLTG